MTRSASPVRTAEGGSRPHERGRARRGRRCDRQRRPRDPVGDGRAWLRRARGRALRLRALGRKHARVRRPPARGARAGLRAAGRLRPGAVLRRWRDLARVGSALCRGRRRRGGQLERLADGGQRAARGRRGEPGRPRAPSGHRRQPELLHDADGDGAEADPRRGAHRARDRLHLPIDLRHRQGRRRRASQPGPLGAGRAAGERLGVPAPDRLQRDAAGRGVQGRRRLHHRGAQDDGRDAQDPRRRQRAGEPHLRAGPGPHRALGVDQRPDTSASCRPSDAARC